MSQPKPAAVHQNHAVVACEHPEVTSTTTVHVLKATRPLIVDAVYYVNPTGLAEHSTNTFSGVVKKGSTTFATLFDTDSDNAEGYNLAANAWVAGVLDADSAKRAFDAGDELDLVLTEGGTADLPAGRIVVEFRYI